MSGIPQGSVLVPLLFLIYIDDTSRISISSCSLTLYADDLVLFRPIHGSNEYQLLHVAKLSDWLLVFQNVFLHNTSYSYVYTKLTIDWRASPNPNNVQRIKPQTQIYVQCECTKNQCIGKPHWMHKEIDWIHKEIHLMHKDNKSHSDSMNAQIQTTQSN